MSCGRERKEKRGGPAEEGGDGPCQQISHPAEASGGGTALELGEPFGGERTSEENGKQEQRDAAYLADER